MTIRSRKDFERVVAETLEDLPERFLPGLENVAVLVRDEPTPDLVDDGQELLGLYVGTPLTERNSFAAYELPDFIYIFRGPILRMCESEEEIRTEIRDTVIHELGHHMGLSDEEMPY